MILGFISINGNYETKNCECHQHKKTQIQNRDRDTHIETPLSYGPSAPCAEYSGGRNSCQAANQPNTRGKTKKQTSQTQGAKPKQPKTKAIGSGKCKPQIRLCTHRTKTKASKKLRRHVLDQKSGICVHNSVVHICFFFFLHLTFKYWIQTIVLYSI